MKALAAPGDRLLAGCSGSAADHERLGDAAYEQSDRPRRSAEYRAASRDQTDGSALGQARRGRAQGRATSVRPPTPTPSSPRSINSRESEAARGLEQVARAADRADAGPGLEDAVDALRRLAPGRVSTRYTIALLRRGQLEPAEAAGIGPLALAAAGDAAAVDSDAGSVRRGAAADHRLRRSRRGVSVLRFGGRVTRTSVPARREGLGNLRRAAGAGGAPAGATRSSAISGLQRSWRSIPAQSAAVGHWLAWAMPGWSRETCSGLRSPIRRRCVPGPVIRSSPWPRSAWAGLAPTLPRPIRGKEPKGFRCAGFPRGPGRAAAC